MCAERTPEVEKELAELELEENRIMRELAEMDEAATNKALSRQRRHSPASASEVPPRIQLNQVLADCEEEVREAKGYIASSTPPLRIARCRRNEGVPTHATYLSRPKGTGVDFTVPVALKEYNAIVKHPIFLNSIRDKCAANKYSDADEYIADMRLLWKNTAAFNKGPGLEWVVQHAKLLLECAEDAVSYRRRQINEIMGAMGKERGRDGKRKRGHSDPNGSSLSALMVGSAIQIYWEDDHKWHTGVIREKSGGSVKIDYENEPNGSEWLDLLHEAKWRLPTTRSKRIETVNKKKKSSGRTGTSSAAADVEKEDLTGLKEEMMAAVQDSKMAILNTIQSRYAAIENKLNRSDALRRVLIAVEEAQDSVHGRLDTMQNTIDKLQRTIEELSARKSTEAERGPAPEKTADKIRSPAEELSQKNSSDNERNDAIEETVDKMETDVEERSELPRRENEKAQSDEDDSSQDDKMERREDEKMEESEDDKMEGNADANMERSVDEKMESSAEHKDTQGEKNEVNRGNSDETSEGNNQESGHGDKQVGEQGDKMESDRCDEQNRRHSDEERTPEGDQKKTNDVDRIEGDAGERNNARSEVVEDEKRSAVSPVRS